MTTIHPSAVVDPAATLAGNVTIGPFCVVGPGVILRDGVVLHSHVAVSGDTTIGAATEVYPFASVGHRPQDLKWRGEASALVIGSNCIIREGVTINPGTQGGGLVTRVGNGCTFLAGSHVGHDCVVEDDVVLSNNVMLAGHVVVGRRAVLGGGAAVHQFVRIGEGAFVGGMSGVEGDLIPYGLAIGNRARLAGLNLVGLRRDGTPAASIRTLQEAIKALFGGEGTLSDRLMTVEARAADDPFVASVMAFVKGRHRRPLCVPAGENERAGPSSL